jgi:hypothetical protein
MGESKPEYDCRQSHTLYVVLQGEFVLYREKSTDPNDDDTLRILAPTLDLHEYKAGPWCQNWKNAKELPKEPLYLRHAYGDRKQPKVGHAHRAIPEYNTDIIVNIGNEKLNAQGARLDIRAPMPLAILSGLSENTDNVVITVWEAGKISHPVVPNPATLIPILLYEWHGDCRPCLRNGANEAVANTCGPSDDFQSLHIFASSPKNNEDAEHAKCAFHKAAKLLGANAAIDWPPGTEFKPIPATPPAGLSLHQVNAFFYDIADIDPCDPKRLQDLFDPNQMPLGSSGNCGPVTGGH